MATVKTKFTNVVRREEENNTGNQKNPVKYDNGEFKGTEELEFQSEPFEAFGKTTRLNSGKLAKKIYDHFKQSFHDLRGCNLFIAPNCAICVEMFFEYNTEPVPEGKIKNLVSFNDLKNKATTNLFDRVKATDNRFNGKTFSLNNETKLLLSKFMYGGDKANQPNNEKVWSNKDVVREVPIPATDPFRRTYNTNRILFVLYYLFNNAVKLFSC